jgi:transcriptional regulator with XRE-family HTH domain
MTSEVRTTTRTGGYAPRMPDLAHARFGPLLRRLRATRGVSQERLAGDAEVSPRHVSFLETGRAAPSREMVLVLSSALELPLRDRNTLLVSAGFAPVYRAAALEGRELEPIRRALDHLLAAHEPFGAIVVDRDWNVLRMNAGAQRLMSWALEGLSPPPESLGNVLRAMLDPRALRGRIANFDEVAGVLVDRMRRELELEADEERRAQITSLLDAADVPPPIAPSEEGPFVAIRLRKGGRELRLFSTITTLGTPIDVTAQELRIESYFPADDATDRALRALAVGSDES